MAGSYEHILGGWSMIENMGDAYEAVEELMYLVQSEIGEQNAKKILKDRLYPMLNGEKERDDILIFIDSLMSS